MQYKSMNNYQLSIIHYHTITMVRTVFKGVNPKGAKALFLLHLNKMQLSQKSEFDLIQPCKIKPL